MAILIVAFALCLYKTPDAVPETSAEDGTQEAASVPVAGAARTLLATVPQTEMAAPDECTKTDADTEVSVEEQDIPETAEAPEAPCLELDDEDAYILAKIAMAEAEGEDTVGKALVIRVVINRVESSGFPDSIHDVIFQPNQFSPVKNGRYERVEPDDDCYAALKMVAVDGWDESEGALYFESASASTWHRENLMYLFTHGNHDFYTEREGEQG
jgi:N-acetylmuramoyl-L-alanine amidase